MITKLSDNLIWGLEELLFLLRCWESNPGPKHVRPALGPEPHLQPLYVTLHKDVEHSFSFSFLVV